MPDLFGCDYYGEVRKSASISECGKYRWWLRRKWVTGGNGKVVCFIMLNPSIADAMIDDPTIKRCMGFAKAWGYSVLSVRNLFPYRATDPRELQKADNPTGGEHGNAEIVAAKTADLVIAAWGASVPFGRDKEVLELLKGKDLYCLKRTKHGHPQHPLYVAAGVKPVIFEGREG